MTTIKRLTGEEIKDFLGGFVEWIGDFINDPLVIIVLIVFILFFLASDRKRRDKQ